MAELITEDFNKFKLFVLIQARKLNVASELDNNTLNVMYNHYQSNILEVSREQSQELLRFLKDLTTTDIRTIDIFENNVSEIHPDIVEHSNNMKDVVEELSETRKNLPWFIYIIILICLMIIESYK